MILDILTDKNGNIDFSQLLDVVRNFEDRFSPSITKYLKRSFISSRVFIQRSCAEEEILPTLLQSLNSLYVSMVFAAVSSNQYVDHARTVRDIMSVVATESYNQPYIPDDNLLASLESFNGVIRPKMDAFGKTEAQVNQGTNAQIIDTYVKEMNLIVGRLVDMEFNVGGDPRNKMKIQMMVQLLPTFITDSVMREFFAVNFKPDFMKRWYQVTAGEISFVKDFLFELDLLEKRNKAIKQDKTGELSDMMERQQSNLWKYIKKIVGYQKERQNIASTVQIFNKYSFDKFCHDAHCDFRRVDNRNKYMNKTMSMIVAVIDSDYNKVDLYYSGLDNKGEYNFNQIKNLAENKQYDLSQVMKAFANTSAPRF